MKITLSDFLIAKFPTGLAYDDAVELCLGLYCCAGLLPNVDLAEPLSKDVIAEAFALFSKQGGIQNYHSAQAISFGANYHNVAEKGHWVEVIASIFKLGVSVMGDNAVEILGRGAS